MSVKWGCVSFLTKRTPALENRLMNYEYICYTISINFAIIIQLSLKWLNFQEHCRFLGLMVFTRPNELNEVSASSQLEDINFPLWDVVVVTCWDPPPDTRQEVALSKPHGKPHFQEKSLRFYFFPNTKLQFTAVLLVERNRMCAPKRRLKGENCQNETLSINKRSRQGAILH